MNKSVLNGIFATTTDLMNHLSEYGTLTDQQITERCSNQYGLDARALLEMTLERDFCKGALDEVINKLKILGNDVEK